MSSAVDVRIDAASWAAARSALEAAVRMRPSLLAGLVRPAARRRAAEARRLAVAPLRERLATASVHLTTAQAVMLLSADRCNAGGTYLEARIDDDGAVRLRDRAAFRPGWTGADGSAGWAAGGWSDGGWSDGGGGCDGGGGS